MLLTQKKFVLVLVIFCSLIDPSFASLECYKCVFVSSGVSTICGEIFDTAANVNNTQTCNGSCYKSTTSVDGVITAIARGCTATCSEVCAEVLDIEGCNYCCDDTKCNKATTTTLSGVVTGTVLLAALSYYV
ncbi:hypothetical protein HOLleu_00579 [Holothuria leucospilota]|uniref:Snake toxin/toxin-like domain-containing protein n=1 Tax=Holothuria leucospilota TaxID=206669 RepID=A0A9Q1CMF7_HOLLE|nr:hypothetical protein HOLleu_00579 [Holothuria leucospilota]